MNALCLKFEYLEEIVQIKANQQDLDEFPEELSDLYVNSSQREQADSQVSPLSSANSDKCDLCTCTVSPY